MGEAKRKCQYNRAVKYAEKNHIEFSIAIRRIRAFDLMSLQYRKATKCPCCGKYELMIDSTDYEYTHNDSWVWCSECGFTSDIHKKYEPLQSYYAFDIVGAMREERELEFSEKSWIEFVLKDTDEIEVNAGLKKSA